MLKVQANSPVPCYKQLYLQIQTAILEQRMLPGHLLPGSRTLAKELGIARNTVISAYTQLETEGYIEARSGVGFVVMDINSPKFDLPSSVHLKSPVESPDHPSTDFTTPVKYNLAHGNLSTEFFSHRLWNHYMADALSLPYSEIMDEYGHHQGHLGLRRELAGYLSRSRGVCCHESQIVLTSGLQESVDVLCKIIFKTGGSVLFEEPGYSKARAVFQNNNVSIVPASLDEHGIDLSSINPAQKSEAVFITPSYQFPTGTIMSIQRRYELLEWAKTHQTFVIEDDYNGEFRYDGNPIPSLQSLDAPYGFENVIYVGSVARSLAPFSNIGYVVLPQSLMACYYSTYKLYSCTVPWTHQFTVKNLIADGHYEKHLRKVRNAFSKRHNLLVKELSTLGKGLEIINKGAGLYFILKIRGKGSSDDFIKAALNQGVKVTSTKGYWHRDPQGHKHEIFLGFSLIELSDVPDCVARLKLAWTPFLNL